MFNPFPAGDKYICPPDFLYFAPPIIGALFFQKLYQAVTYRIEYVHAPFFSHFACAYMYTIFSA